MYKCTFNRVGIFFIEKCILSVINIINNIYSIIVIVFGAVSEYE